MRMRWEAGKAGRFADLVRDGRRHVIQSLQRFVQIQRCVARSIAIVLSTGNAVLVDVDGIVDVPMLQQSLPGGRIGPKVLLLMLGEHVQSSSFLDVIVTRMQSGQERERGRRVDLSQGAVEIDDEPLAAPRKAAAIFPNACSSSIGTRT